MVCSYENTWYNEYQVKENQCSIETIRKRRPSARGGPLPGEAQCQKKPSAREGPVQEEAQCKGRPSARGDPVPEEAQCKRRPSARGGPMVESLLWLTVYGE